MTQTNVLFRGSEEIHNRWGLFLPDGRNVSSLGDTQSGRRVKFWSEEVRSMRSSNRFPIYFTRDIGTFRGYSRDFRRV